MFLFGLRAAAQAPPALPTHHVPEAVSRGEARFLHPMPPSEVLRVNFLFPIRDQAALDKFLKDIYDPSSTSYQHFLTVARFTERFAPTQQDYDTVASFAQENGMSVVYTPPNRLALGVTASVADIERTFHVSMGIYQHPTEPRTFFAPDREPTVGVGVSLWQIGGLDNFSTPRPLYIKAQRGSGVVSNVTGSGPNGSFLGSDRRAAYYGQTTLTGSGQSVGLFQLDGYNQSDVNAYFSNVGQTLSIPINNVLVDGASGGSDGDDTEQAIDIAEAASMAPGLSQIRMYIGPKGSFSSGVTDFDILNKMATDNIAKQLSCSWAWKPADPRTDDPVFQQMASQGQNLFVASGDNGSYPNSSGFYFPAEDPNIIAVGGTALTTNGPGGSWQSEVAWSGSGGGVSPDHLTIPSYQQLSGVINSSNGGSTVYRNGPDVAAEANTDNYFFSNGSYGTGLGGTSLAAPTWAGYLALANQQAASNGSGAIGFINPQIYSIGVGPGYSSAFHDVSSGSTGGFSAVAGYDLATGWGSPNGAGLISDLANVSLRRPASYQDDSSGSTSCDSGTFQYSGSGVLNTTQTNFGIDAQADATSNPGSFISQNILTSWQTGSGYTSLTLFIDSVCSIKASGSDTESGSCAVDYSTDGVVFTNLRYASGDGSGWGEAVDQIALSPSQDLSKLRIRVCAQANSWRPDVDGTASAFTQVIDARTVGALP
ncbi:MAG TPA: S53 family peptidase [Candidatus Acidoferrum sp.]|nr:S53 family peptidase [Candidatus Acidoferrum sp.]